MLSKIAREKDCEALNEWIKPCKNHLHWSATSTFSGNGIVIWAKFKSFLQHIVNIHSGHKDPLFKKCAHSSDIEARKWLTIGMLYQGPMYNIVEVVVLSRIINSHGVSTILYFDIFIITMQTYKELFGMLFM